MEKRIYPPKPHFIVGYAGHCPKYRYIQKEQGAAHQFCIDRCQKFTDTDAKSENEELQDHKLTFTEIDLVMAYERDPNYILPSPPSPENFLSVVNNQLGPKPSCDYAATVAAYRQKMKHAILEKTLAKRIEALHPNKMSSTAKEQAFKQPVYKTRDTDENATKGEKDLQIPQTESPYQKFVKDRKKIFNVYRKDSGLVPRYAGHVPGSSLRFGSTFGHDSYNAKQWLKKSYMDAYH